MNNCCNNICQNFCSPPINNCLYRQPIVINPCVRPRYNCLPNYYIYESIYPPEPCLINEYYDDYCEYCGYYDCECYYD